MGSSSSSEADTRVEELQESLKREKREHERKMREWEMERKKRELEHEMMERELERSRRERDLFTIESLNMSGMPMRDVVDLFRRMRFDGDDNDDEEGEEDDNDNDDEEDDNDNDDEEDDNDNDDVKDDDDKDEESCSTSNDAPYEVKFTTDKNKPDVITFDDDEDTPRALMPCGHAITSESMIRLCTDAVSNKKHQITCPACPRILEWSWIEQVVKLTDENKKLIMDGLSENFLVKTEGYFSCPSCKVWCKRLDLSSTIVRCAKCSGEKNKNFEFCCRCFLITDGNTTKCSNENCSGIMEKLTMLQNCDMKKIDNENCPRMRACPKCGLLIEHLDKCKHMTCKQCKHEFCFVCLKPFLNNDHLQKKCYLAQRQTTLPKD